MVRVVARFLVRVEVRRPPRAVARPAARRAGPVAGRARPAAAVARPAAAVAGPAAAVAMVVDAAVGRAPRVAGARVAGPATRERGGREAVLADVQLGHLPVVAARAPSSAAAAAASVRAQAQLGVGTGSFSLRVVLLVLLLQGISPVGAESILGQRQEVVL